MPASPQLLCNKSVANGDHFVEIKVVSAEDIRPQKKTIQREKLLCDRHFPNNRMKRAKPDIGLLSCRRVEAPAVGLRGIHKLLKHCWITMHVAERVGLMVAVAGMKHIYRKACTIEVMVFGGVKMTEKLAVLIEKDVRG